MSLLFTPLTVRGTTFRNRAWVAPMCQYSATDGRPGDWHLVHLGALARGGAGLVIQEATAVTAAGRISPADLGIWNDAQAGEFRRITDFIHSQGALAGIQLAHAGRKGSTRVPWLGENTAPADEGGWQTVAPSALAFGGYDAPLALSLDEVRALPQLFADAALRAADAGYDVVEIHSAHGYLLHQFLSPLANQRTDDYGGSELNRTRLVLEVARAVRAVWQGPLFVRISATDYVADGWDLEQSVRLCQALREVGVDLIDVSSGGLDPRQQIAVRAGYQVQFASAIRAQAAIPTAAVGLITDASHAESILAAGDADAIEMAREYLRDPSWAQRAQFQLDGATTLPPQYERAAWRA